MKKQEQKKKWKKPELTILVRSNPDVAVLLLETEFVISLFTREPSMIYDSLGNTEFWVNGVKMIKLRALVIGILFCLVTGTGVHAGNSIEAAGEVLTLLLPATAAGLTVGFKDGQGALQLVESVALTAAVTYGLKYTITESAPNGDSHSFPSAHTSLSFASAEFLLKRYGWQYGIPAYVAATFVAVSRVEAKDHYTHDVLAGAAIGIASSYLFTRPYKGWNVQPEAGEKHYGIRLSRTW
jgi:membrane-associated phospholipid phosphatase